MKIQAEQAKIAYQYKDIKLKLYKTNENIKFNKACLEHNVIPNYIKVKVYNKSNSALKAKRLAESNWLKNEIKALYGKKSLLNNLLMSKHLELLNALHVTQQHTVLSNIEQQISRKLITKRNTQTKKLRLLMEKQHHNEIIKCSHVFYKRVVNLTNIHFDENEINLLNKGLNFNFPNNKKSSLFSELLNTEASIKRIKDNNIRESARILISNKAKNLMKNTPITRKHNLKFNTNQIVLASIKSKLTKHDALITKADKGSSVVILHKQDYNDKVLDFFNKNNIKLLNKNPTLNYSKEINKAISKSKTLLNNNEIISLKMMNPQAPIFRGLPKIHKENIPIRPLVNFIPSPAYKIAKKLDQIIRSNVILENSRNIRNSVELVEKIKSQYIIRNYKLASFDIVNLYTNIPIHETITILKENLHKHSSLPPQAIDELTNLTRIVLKQNYFQFQNDFYYQEEGLAMGSPLSSILAELFLNHIENNFLFTPTNRHLNKIIFYYRYVDDTIVLFNGNNRELNLLNSYLNNMHKNIKFTLDEESNNALNFLDLTITKDDNKLKFKIYRKPTCTNQTIHEESHHPYSQKIAAYNSFVHRLLSIPMCLNDFNEELNTIKHIAVTNGYNSSLIDKLVKKHKTKTKNKSTEEEKTYISATYGSNLSNHLKNILSKDNITVSFRTVNKLSSLLKEQPQTKTPIFNKNGVYKINCNDCPMYYIGQTGRSFQKRFQEHIPKITTSHQTSKFAEHLLKHNHNYDNINKNMKILHYSNDKHERNTLEEFEIYKSVKCDVNNVLNDKLSFESNYIYDTTIQLMKQGEKQNNWYNR